jgi:hypothetical protein
VAAVSAAPRVVAIAQSANLGDVVSCLPMAAALKERFPGVKVLFIARAYARALVEACTDVDGFLDSGAVLADPQLLHAHRVDALINPFLVDAFGIAARAAGCRCGWGTCAGCARCAGRTASSTWARARTRCTSPT